MCCVGTPRGWFEPPDSEPGLPRVWAEIAHRTSRLSRKTPAITGGRRRTFCQQAQHPAVVGGVIGAHCPDSMD